MSAIYAIKNKSNGMMYIGQTKNSIAKRWSQHIANSSGKSPLHDAIRKYGSDNFEIFAIESGDFTKDELNKKEAECILKLNTVFPNGYNIFKGGDDRNLLSVSRDKIRNTLTERKITWSDKISETMKEKWNDEGYRKHMSEVHSRPYGKYRKHKKPLRIELPIDEIKELYKNGKTINAISNEYGVCYETIKRRLLNGN